MRCGTDSDRDCDRDSRPPLAGTGAAALVQKLFLDRCRVVTGGLDGFGKLLRRDAEMLAPLLDRSGVAEIDAFGQAWGRVSAHDRSGREVRVIGRGNRRAAW